MENEIFEILKQIQKEQIKTNERLDTIELGQNEIKVEIKSDINEITSEINEITAEIKDFKNQFTDFEGKSANNHVEVVNKIDNMKKDLNTMELVTSKNWNDIAHLKAIK